MSNIFLFFGSGIKFFNVVLLGKNKEENYQELDAQAEQCLTGIGKMQNQGVYAFYMICYL